MAKTREQVGEAPCLVCAQAVPVKKSEGGSLSFSCPWCDFSAYAKPGTQAYSILAPRVKVKASEAPEVLQVQTEKKADASPAPAPVVVKAAPRARFPWE